MAGTPEGMWRPLVLRLYSEEVGGTVWALGPRTRLRPTPSEQWSLQPQDPLASHFLVVPAGGRPCIPICEPA